MRTRFHPALRLIHWTMAALILLTVLFYVFKLQPTQRTQTH